MWAVMCVCRHVCHTQVLSCLSAGVGVEPLFCLGFWDCGRACAKGGGWGTFAKPGVHLVEREIGSSCFSRVTCQICR